MTETLDIEERINARKVAPLSELVPRSPAWLKARQQGIGGSDAAAIMGLGEFRSAFETYLTKVGSHPDGLGSADSPASYWGVVLEDPIAEECGRRNSLRMVKPEYLYAHRDFDWLLANPDRFAITKAGELMLYEGKTAGMYMADRWGEEPDEPATYALLQAVHYLEVLDLDVAIIAVLIGGQDYREYRLERDAELGAAWLAHMTNFWDHVMRREPPPVTGMASDKDILSRMWDAVDGKRTIVGDEAVDAAQRYHTARGVEKKAHELAETAGNELRLMMGDASEAVTASGLTVATWKAQSTTKFAQKRFEAEMPKFSNTYKYKETIRVLRPKDL